MHKHMAIIWLIFNNFKKISCILFQIYCLSF